MYCSVRNWVPDFLCICCKPCISGWLCLFFLSFFPAVEKRKILVIFSSRKFQKNSLSGNFSEWNFSCDNINWKSPIAFSRTRVSFQISRKPGSRASSKDQLRLPLGILVLCSESSLGNLACGSRILESYKPLPDLVLQHLTFLSCLVEFSVGSCVPLSMEQHTGQLCCWEYWVEELASTDGPKINTWTV